MTADIETITRLHKNRVIALGMGWKILQPAKLSDIGEEIEGPYWYDETGRYVGGGSHDPVPNFFESQDACQRAAETLISAYWSMYLGFLEVACNTHFGAVTGDCKRFLESNPPAEKRAEALFLTFHTINR